MKAIEILQPHALQIIQVQQPALDEVNNVMVKIKVAGICGSDMGIYHGTNAAATYPRVIGHEMVGEVTSIGDNVTNIKVGDRVIIDQVTSCGTCYACRKGRGNVCANLKVRGVHISGGYQEYVAVPEHDCYILPQGISDEDAIMIEPTTIAVQACSRAELTAEDTLLLLGYGALGGTVLKIARLSGAKIIVADVVDEKLALALENGADVALNLTHEDFEQKLLDATGQYGPTVSIDSACTKDSLPLLLKVTGNAGRVISMGFSIAPIDGINSFMITSKELDLRGSRLQNKKFGEVIKLVENGTLDLKDSISHSFHFTEAQQAFDYVDSRDPLIRKVVLKFM